MDVEECKKYMKDSAERAKAKRKADEEARAAVTARAIRNSRAGETMDIEEFLKKLDSA